MVLGLLLSCDILIVCLYAEKRSKMANPLNQTNKRKLHHIAHTVMFIPQCKHFRDHCSDVY